MIELNPSLQQYVEEALSIAERMPQERRNLLAPVVNYLSTVISKQKHPQLLFVCTHNSRRSIFAQVWDQLAAWKFGIQNFHSHSAGSETTALHPNTRDALIRAGIRIEEMKAGVNPLYRASFSESIPTLSLFSKDIDFSELPKENFGAVLVCVNDAEYCPFIPKADVRIPLPYSDPKKFDGTHEMEAAYDRCCRQIASEMFYVMKAVAEKK